MREIKFKAFHKGTGVMSKAFTLLDALLRNLIETIEWKNGILLQFTGLKDKNGKECYEGDLVKYDGNERVYEVAWSMGGFHSMPVDSKFDSSAKEWRGVGFTDFEVVGNIWES